jgi:hypothetical protein
VSQGCANGVFLICEKSYVRKTKLLLKQARTIKRKDMQEKPVRLPFCLTAIKPPKRFNAAEKSFVRETLLCSTGSMSLTSQFPAMPRKVLREKITMYSEKYQLTGNKREE